MRIRKKKWAEPELSVCDFFVKNPEENAGKWKSSFKKEQPVYLEIGCGKGGFAGRLGDLGHPQWEEASPQPEKPAAAGGDRGGGIQRRPGGHGGGGGPQPAVCGGADQQDDQHGRFDGPGL